ncbi:MAG TPA: sirohydrochlorin chelatase [Chloroflexota bacterium]|nr:sirohydrochlorin chelatase [Chloroflexota bacterium]
MSHRWQASCLASPAGPLPDGGVVLLGHGSRDPVGAAEFLAIADAVRRALPDRPVEAGVLEFAGPVAPSIPEAFARCVARGARRILALPVLLHFGGHATADMPEQAAAARERHPHAEIRLAQPLAGHPALLDVVADRCAATALGPARDATVLLVGRGSTSPRANADLFASARLFEERGDYAAAEVCFVSLAPPDVPAGLRRCVALGARRIIVAPYFVNTGLLVHRIAAEVEAARRVYADTEVAVAAHFGPDPRLITALLDRGRDAWPELMWEPGARGQGPGDDAGPRFPAPGSRPLTPVPAPGPRPLAPAGGPR